MNGHTCRHEWMIGNTCILCSTLNTWVDTLHWWLFMAVHRGIHLSVSLQPQDLPTWALNRDRQKLHQRRIKREMEWGKIYPVVCKPPTLGSPHFLCSHWSWAWLMRSLPGREPCKVAFSSILSLRGHLLTARLLCSMFPFCFWFDWRVDFGERPESLRMKMLMVDKIRHTVRHIGGARVWGTS